ncbi:MAG: hypothetical protein ACTSU4_04860 [Promethearchaeota archaeon]
MKEENSEKKIDELVKQLKKKIIEKEIEDFNEYIVNLYHEPINWGSLEGEDLTVK